MIKKEYQEITVTKDICTNLMTLPLLLFLGQLLSQEPQMRKKNQLLYSTYYKFHPLHPPFHTGLV